MTTPEGAFAASIDADSEGHEGRFYVWTQDEIADVLGDEQAAFFARAYGVYPDGNWEGVNILNRLGTMTALPEADEARLADAREKLLARRDGRVRPATDDKVLADWNGLMIAALAFAGATFSRTDWIAMADRAFRFITGPMARGDRLAHSWRDDKSIFPGLATDYANMITAALALHVATLEPGYLTTAEKLAATLRSHHRDDATPGYFLSADDAEALIVRPRSVTDEATPSANSVMAQNLVRLWHLTGADAYREDADAIIQASAPAVAANLFATTGMLSALDLRLHATDVVIVAPTGVQPSTLVDTSGVIGPRTPSSPSTRERPTCRRAIPPRQDASRRQTHRLCLPRQKPAHCRQVTPRQWTRCCATDTRPRCISPAFGTKRSTH